MSMKLNKIIGSLFIVLLVTFACKNTESNKNENNKNSPTGIKKKVLTQSEKDQINSVMTKAMVTPEAKTFVRFIVTDGLTSMLSKEKGPFTLLIPSVDAFNNLKEAVNNELKNPKKKSFLDSLLKSHIVKSDVNTIVLTKKINEGNGMYQTINLLGNTLTFTKVDGDLLVTDDKGIKAKLTKTDIKGDNGVLHILDGVLGVKNE